MSISIGDRILASDFNTLKDDVNKWFGDIYAGTISFGDSNQTYGYGGVNVDAAADGSIVTPEQMNSLIDRCNIGVTISDVVTGSIDRVARGERIIATKYNETETKSSSLNTNRFDITAAEFSLLDGGNSQRTTSYSTPIDCIFRYQFTDFDEARYFFNSGGSIDINGTITGYSTGTGFDGQGINDILTSMGTVSMNYTETTQSGSGGSLQSVGFYDLSTSWTLLFQQAGAGAYSNAYVRMWGRRLTGDYVDILIEIYPEDSRTVDGTTTMYGQYRIIDEQDSGGASLVIADPVFSVTDNF